MDKKTADKLNKLNQEFYLKTQEYFNRTRQFYWQGWEKLLPYLQSASRRIKVLDIGCGNGRFGKFLKERDRKIEYTGVDNNEYLLNQVIKSVPEGKLINQDILNNWKIKDKFDLVAILGVIHHFQPKKARELLIKAVKRLNKGGILFLSTWEFDKAKDAKKLKALGNNNYIVDWQTGVEAERYCHLYTDKEVTELIGKLNLKKLDDYEDDGSNRYVILKAGPR